MNANIEETEEYGAEIYRDEFIKMIKEKGPIRASLSHTQLHPSKVSCWTILDWQYDGDIFAITAKGTRVVASEKMPAFRPFIGDIAG